MRSSHNFHHRSSITIRYSSYVRKNGDTVPAKLTHADMEIVADYVLEMAKEGWK